MKVKLISYTSDALPLLLYTKNTRLQGSQSLQDIIDWPMHKKLEHLAYMRDTIQSSWEFIDYVFEITDVTRAFTHQLVRTRTGSYAQESQRTVDVSDHTWRSDVEDEWCADYFEAAMNDAMDNYSLMLNKGVPAQQARGILPTNIHTNIIAKFNLRTLHDMAKTRLCFRTQGEYQEVFRAMLREVIIRHPWAEDFIQVACVATGVCAFPRYTECPIQKFTVPTVSLDLVKTTLKSHWEATEHEATPIAKDGKTM